MAQQYAGGISLDVLCPALKGFKAHPNSAQYSAVANLWRNKETYCTICQKFVGLSPMKTNSCPCIILTCEEAWERTTEKLMEEDGYV